MMFLLFLLVLLLIFMAMRYKYNQMLLMEKLSSVPQKKPLPFLGNILDIRHFKDTHELWPKIVKIFETIPGNGIKGFWFGPAHVICVAEPKYIQAIMSTSAGLYKTPEVHDKAFKNFAYGLFSANGARWKELRRPFLRTFKPTDMEGYHNVFVQRTEIFIKHLNKEICGKGEFNVASKVGGLLLDIINETHTGVISNEGTENKYDFHHYVNEFIKMTTIKLMRFHYYLIPGLFEWTENGKRMISSLTKIDIFGNWILEERMQLVANRKTDKEYYLDYLINRGFKEGHSKDDIRKELMDILVAGSDTSTVLTSSILVFLAMFPLIQETAYKEQLKIFSTSNRSSTMEDVSAMNYLTRVMKESLRHVSPPGVFRTATENLTIDKYKFPSGSIFFLMFQMVHKDPRNWKNPHCFDPDHFLPEVEAQRHRSCYIPFGSGARACPGSQYGFNSIKVVISYILRNFKLSTNMKFEDIKYNYGFLLEIEPGFIISIESRSE